MIRIGVRSFVAAVSGGGTDADAQAFITAAGITDATQQSAINTLVTDLKGYSIWSKMKAIYPFVGGTSSTHKWNLKDPRDLDAAFRLVFNGGWTHSSNGVTPNGTNGYANTFFSPAANMSSSSSHFTQYIRNNSTGFYNDNGIFDASNTNAIALNSRDASGNNISIIGNQSTNRITTSNTTSIGYHQATRTSNTVFKMFVNASQIGTTNTVNFTGMSTITGNMIIGATALNNGSSIVNYSIRNYAFFTLGDGLTDTEAANLYTAVQAYQTTLSRNV
jgi:hypothetical protein